MLFEMLASAFFSGPFYSRILFFHILIPWANVSNIQFFVLYRNSIFTFFLELLVNLDALKYVRFKPFLLNNCALNIIYEHLTWSLLPYSEEKEREREKKNCRQNKKAIENCATAYKNLNINSKFMFE